MSRNQLARRIEALERRDGGEDQVWVIYHSIVGSDLNVVRGDNISSHDGAFSIERAPNESDQDFESRALGDAEKFARANDRVLMIFHELEL
jgi:hypothetical protein